MAPHSLKWYPKQRSSMSEPSAFEPGPSSAAQLAPQESEQQPQLLGRYPDSTPSNLRSSVCSIAQRAWRDCEQQERSSGNAPTPPPLSNVGSNMRLIKQQDHQRQEGLSGGGAPPSVNRRAGRPKCYTKKTIFWGTLM